jgi:PAS domain S-box-containing protein
MLVNDRLCEMIGYSREELTRKTFDDITHPDDLAADWEQAKAVLQGHLRTYSMEKRYFHKNGAVVWINLTVSLVRDEQGDPAYFISVIEDITERKKAEDRFRLVVEAAPNAMIMVGTEGCIALVNSQTEKLFGYRREELVGQGIEMLVPKRFRHDHSGHRGGFFAAPSARAMGTGRELFGVRKDGTEVPIEIGLNPIRVPEGQYVLASIIDISEAKQLRHDGERWVALLENSPNYIGLATPDGSRVLYVNQAGRELFGLPSPEHLRTMSVFDLSLAQDRSLMKLVRDTVENQGKWTGEAKFLHFCTREPIPVEMNSFMVREPGSGRLLAWAVVARDIRERKRAEERLHALTGQLMTALGEERRRIARELHDDITQKLAVLGIDLGLVRKDLESAALSERLGLLQEQILTLSEDVRQLAYQFHPSVLQHSGIVAAMDTHCQEVSRQGKIAVDFVVRDVPSALPQDISLTLYRIAQEALRNVVKHSSATSVSVVLACVKETDGNRKLRLSVMDNGRGFLTEDVPKGAGLGLLGIEERVRLVNGRCEITSVPMEGTRVEVEVPLVEAEV